MESVLENAENEKGALRQKLLDGAGPQGMSYELGTINTDAPVSGVWRITGSSPLCLQTARRADKAELRAVINACVNLQARRIKMKTETCLKQTGKNAAEFDLRNVKVMKSCGPALIRFCNALSAFDI